MNKPKVSILIPVYNVENYITRCLDSIVNQTYKNIEILIDNDGSTDSSYEICKYFLAQDKRIRLFSQMNVGLAKARNILLSHVTGDYVMFVDSDDFIDLDSIEKLVNLALSTNVDCIHFSFDKILNGGGYVKEKRTKCRMLSASKHVRRMIIPLKGINKGCYVWAKFFKVQFIKYLHFPEGQIFEDIIAVPQMVLKMNKIIETNEIFYHYVMRNGSILHSNDLLERYCSELNAYIYLYNAISEKDTLLKYCISFTFLYEYYCRKHDIKINSLDYESFIKNFAPYKRFFLRKIFFL